MASNGGVEGSHRGLRTQAAQHGQRPQHERQLRRLQRAGKLRRARGQAHDHRRAGRRAPAGGLQARQRIERERGVPRRQLRQVRRRQCR